MHNAGKNSEIVIYEGRQNSKITRTRTPAGSIVKILFPGELGTVEARPTERWPRIVAAASVALMGWFLMVAIVYGAHLLNIGSYAEGRVIVFKRGRAAPKITSRHELEGFALYLEFADQVPTVKSVKRTMRVAIAIAAIVSIVLLAGLGSWVGHLLGSGDCTRLTGMDWSCWLTEKTQMLRPKKS